MPTMNIRSVLVKTVNEHVWIWYYTRRATDGVLKVSEVIFGVLRLY